MQKFWEISRQIHDFLTWKQVECPFEKDKKIQSYLLTAPIYSEEGKAPYWTLSSLLTWSTEWRVNMQEQYFISMYYQFHTGSWWE